jgi:ferritin-like metal-binding protein YciE
MMSMRNLEELLVGELRDLHAGQSELAVAFPKMARAASSRRLRNDFEGHAEQARSHARRLEVILESLSHSTRGAECYAKEGTVDILVYGELVPVESSESTHQPPRHSEIEGEVESPTPAHAMRGLIEEGERLADELEDSPIKDVGLMAEAQLLEHYTVAAFRTAREHARMLGHAAAEALLDKALAEKNERDANLKEHACEQID